MPHYVIKPKKNGSDDPGLKPRIVEAKNQARALAFVVEDTLIIDLAEPADYMQLATDGGKIETAK